MLKETDGKRISQQVIAVLILMLMEHAQRGSTDDNYVVYNIAVLILILMEHAQRAELP